MTPLLVFSNRHEVRGVELPALTARALISSLKNTIALDWRRDPASGAVQLYWTDVVDDNIYRGLVVGNGASLSKMFNTHCGGTFNDTVT